MADDGEVPVKLEDVSVEVMHAIIYESGALKAADILNLALTSKRMSELVIGDDFAIRRAKSTLPLKTLVKRGEWRAILSGLFYNVYGAQEVADLLFLNGPDRFDEEGLRLWTTLAEKVIEMGVDVQEPDDYEGGWFGISDENWGELYAGLYFGFENDPSNLLRLLVEANGPAHKRNEDKDWFRRLDGWLAVGNFARKLGGVVPYKKEYLYVFTSDRIARATRYAILTLGDLDSEEGQALFDSISGAAVASITRTSNMFSKTLNMYPTYALLAVESGLEIKDEQVQASLVSYYPDTRFVAYLAQRPHVFVTSLPFQRAEKLDSLFASFYELMKRGVIDASAVLQEGPFSGYTLIEAMLLSWTGFSLTRFFADSSLLPDKFPSFGTDVPVSNRVGENRERYKLVMGDRVAEAGPSA